VARLALSLFAVLLKKEVVAAQFMASLTVRLACIESRWPAASKRVFSGRHRLEMGRVAAQSVLAQVIQLQAWRNVAD
jgi:hypothetical protein